MKIQSDGSNVQTREAGRIEAARIQSTSGIPQDMDLTFMPSVGSSPEVGQPQAPVTEPAQPDMVQGQEGVEPGLEEYQFTV
jgi:hypothetical protein